MSIIRNYGLFWTELDTDWGKRGAAGSLRGVKAKNSTGPDIDFAEQVGIYVLYADYRIVYVGQTGSGDQKLLRRLRDHRRDHLAGRWNQYSWFGTRSVNLNGSLKAEQDGLSTSVPLALDHMEAILIAASEPPLNRQGGSFGAECDQYLQVRDEDVLGPDTDEMIHDIYDRVQALQQGIKSMKPKKAKT